MQWLVALSMTPAFPFRISLAVSSAITLWVLSHAVIDFGPKFYDTRALKLMLVGKSR